MAIRDSGVYGWILVILVILVFNSEKWILIDYLSGIRKICGRFTKVLVGIPNVRDNQKIQLRGQRDDIESCLNELENYYYSLVTIHLFIFFTQSFYCRTV